MVSFGVISVTSAMVAQEDIAAALTISPPANTDGLNLTNALFAMTLAELIQYGKEELGQTDEEAALYAACIEEHKQEIELVKQQAFLCDSVEAEEHLACHGIHPNHLFQEILETPTKEAMAEVLDLSGNFPHKKRPRMREEHYG
jgi:hypothetical protein